MSIQLRKHFLVVLSLFSLYGSVAAVPSHDERSQIALVKSAFAEANITRDLGIDFNPVAQMEVTWPAPNPGDSPFQPSPGDLIYDNYTTHIPTFTLLGRPHDVGPYVVFVLDPDAPTPDKPTWRSIRHLAGANYYLTGGDSILRNTTAPPAPWHRPIPFNYSREHRYVFLAYKQPESFIWNIEYDEPSHQNFDVAAFSRQQELGNPVAGNFFWIENHASCWREGCQPPAGAA